jgi:DNA repair protein RadB
MEPKMSTGCSVVNDLLCGGYECDVITTVYGPAGTGKTTMCLMCSIAAVKSGKKVIYVDTEGGFSVERIRQLEGFDESMLKSILVMKPTNFEEQSKAVRNVRQMVNDKIGLVVVDTISMLYRIECGRTKEVKSVNSELGLQIGMLNEIARKLSIPVLITNQVYSDFDERESVRMVGGDILAYSSKCLIELAKVKNSRKAIVKKHRSLPEREEGFEIEGKGFTTLNKK